MYEALQLERDSSIGILTLNQPEKRNAMTPQLTKEFADAIAEVSQDANIRVLILAANGPAFSAGGDRHRLEQQLDWSPEENRRFMSKMYRTWLGLLYLDVPTIAAISGPAIGAGLSLTLACDIRIAADDVKLAFTYVNLGLHPGMGTTHLLPLLVGTAHASELIFSGRTITGSEAAKIGLVNRAVPADQVRKEARTLAKEIATKSPTAIRMAKRALAQFKLQGLEAALDYEAAAQMVSFASPEMREAFEMLKKKEEK